jgi:hypothetical protein
VSCGNECKIEQVRDVSLFPVDTRHKQFGEGKEKNFAIDRVLKDLVLLRVRFTIVDGDLTELYNI